MHAEFEAMVLRRWSVRAILILLALGGTAVAAVYLFNIGGVDAPAGRTPATVLALDQGPDWNENGSSEYHHKSQGTRILPLSWFFALEQPLAVPFSTGRFAARDYLSRFGFFYDTQPPKDESNPLQPDLPIGFAVEENFVAGYADPPVPKPIRVVGLTCAGCHTGRIDIPTADGGYKGVRIEGGSAMINLLLFQKATGQALFFTRAFEARFGRFAAEVERIERVLDPKLNRAGAADRKAQLREDLKRFIDLGLAGARYAKEHKLYTTDAGFARTDALGLIGNRVFGVLDVENQIVTDAPVNFPHLWDTPWFDWVQYNASIRTPMARNIGEALGVGALVNVTGKTGQPYDSTVNVEGLAWIEDKLGGNNPFEGLQPPRWGDMVEKVFGDDRNTPSEYRLDDRLVQKGAALYQRHCQRCHLPPRDKLKEDLRAQKSTHFTETDSWSPKKFLKVVVVDVNTIGTDPNQALNFYRRVAISPEPVVPKAETYESDWYKQGYGRQARFATISAEEGLFRITSLIRKRNYEALGLFAPSDLTDPAQRKAIARKRMEKDRYRFVPAPLDLGDEAALINGEGIDWVIKANLGYKARPLDGIWATPPYLHNGSVPSLYQVLLPAAGRLAAFYLGSTRFDPKHVGYETRGFPGAFKMDTTQSGNSNKGHEFRNLELEEFESTENKPAGGQWTREQRWAKVLEVRDDELRTMATEDRWRQVRAATEKALREPRRAPFRGVLGPELEDGDRWALVEYLKTL
jgi:hypothetical protein